MYNSNKNGGLLQSQQQQQPQQGLLRRVVPSLVQGMADTNRFYQQARMNTPQAATLNNIHLLRNVTPAGIAAQLPQLRAQEQAAQDKAASDRMMAQAGLLSAQSKTSGLFSGTGMTAQAMNVIREIGPLIEAGKANSQQLRDYKLAELSLSKPRTQQTFDPETGTQSFFEVPGMDLSAAGFPAFAETKSLGSKEPKYTEGQLEAGKFANVIWNAERELGQIVGEGYDGTDLSDRIAGMSGNTFKSYLTSPEGQRYKRAKMSFLLATLRDESGAAIGEEEYVNKEDALFPLPGDTPEMVRVKTKARAVELEGMIKSSGKFYERSFKDQTIENLYKPDVGSGFDLSLYGTKGEASNPVRVKSVSEGDALPAGTYYSFNGQLGISK